MTSNRYISSISWNGVIGLAQNNDYQVATLICIYPYLMILKQQNLSFSFMQFSGDLLYGWKFESYSGRYRIYAHL